MFFSICSKFCIALLALTLSLTMLPAVSAAEKAPEIGQLLFDIEHHDTSFRYFFIITQKNARVNKSAFFALFCFAKTAKTIPESMAT